MQNVLIEFITQELLSGRPTFELKAEDELLANELLDSMAIMRLIAFIEGRYDVRIPAEDVMIENFRTIDTISSYLQERLP